MTTLVRLRAERDHIRHEYKRIMSERDNVHKEIAELSDKIQDLEGKLDEANKKVEILQKKELLYAKWRGSSLRGGTREGGTRGSIKDTCRQNDAKELEFCKTNSDSHMQTTINSGSSLNSVGDSRNFSDFSERSRTNENINCNEANENEPHTTNPMTSDLLTVEKFIQNQNQIQSENDHDDQENFSEIDNLSSDDLKSIARGLNEVNFEQKQVIQKQNEEIEGFRLAVETLNREKNEAMEAASKFYVGRGVCGLFWASESLGEKRDH